MYREEGLFERSLYQKEKTEYNRANEGR